MTVAESDNIVRTGKPSRTALRVAKLRAAHQLLDEPLVLADPLALPILGAEEAAAMTEDPFQYNDALARGVRAALVVRSAFAEDEAARAAAAGVRQYVVLGAGLDTFAYRRPETGLALRVFEVDAPSTQQWKRHLLAEAGIALPENLTFAPVDFEHDTLAEGLAAASFDAGQPACFSWLGVTMYLSEAAILATLGYVASLPEGSSITLDFRVPDSMLNPVQRVVSGIMAQRVASIGEPWVTAFEPTTFRAQLLALGFGEVEILDPETLNRRYLHRRKDGLHTGGWLLCARV
jgi:methyltransferase (TIGR00027 family)